MSLENWDKIKEIFLAAIDLAQEDRTRHLDHLCGDNKVLRAQVEKLIAQEEESESLMQRPLMEESGLYTFAASFDVIDPMIGRRVGNYEILREIGQGGMGSVYLAARADGSFEQQVAVKLVRGGMNTRFVLQRFRQERQVLARLNHRFIAQLLNGGTTEEGLPYFVMEYIEGKTVYKFSDDQKLSIKERLKLFRLICEAVAYAHLNNVIHRDLKPSNVLVKTDGTPKLLDFGIAKVLNPDLQSNTGIDPTLTAMRMMTPEYASPEQVKGEAVTAASDVYSLGVVLYELLTGHRPYRFKNRAAHEIARVICEEEPASPSAGIVKEDDFVPTNEKIITLEKLYLLRGSGSLEELKQELAGDLERIVLKALRKNSQERYQTAGELADDIENYLDGKPVSASAPVTFAKQTLISKTKTSPAKAVAVLPLKFLNTAASEDTGDQFLSIGLADAIITRLSGVRQFIVRPTGSIVSYEEKQTDGFTAGKELGVDFVVDGTIRRLGKRIRVSAQLLDVKDHSTIWAQAFDEDFEDFLTLEDSISQKIAKSLLLQLTGEDKTQLKTRGTEDPQAYAAYLRGRYFANQFSEDALLRSVEAYREAVRLDPDYALPHVGIAEFYVWTAVFGAVPTREAYPRAKEELRRALEANDSLCEAFSLSAFIALLYDWDWGQAEHLIKRALEINPNYYAAHDTYAHILASQGILEKAIAEIKSSEELDPLSPRAKLMTSCILYQSRDFKGGAVKAEESLRMQEISAQGFLHLGNSLTHLNAGNPRAVEVLTRSAEIWETSALPKFMLCFALVADGQRNKAEQILQEILELAETGFVKPYFVAMAHTALGNIDEAFAWFERAVETRDDWMLWFGTDIKLDALRNDERYFGILKKTNNPIFARQLSKANQTAKKSEKSIAILPLTIIGAGAMGEPGDDEYLSIGLADALITRLSKVQRFIVRPTSSILPYGKKTVDALRAGEELNVDFVVDTNLRRNGNRIRISSQLLNVKEHSTLWAAKFDDDFTDALALEDSISQKIAKSLLPFLSGEEERQLKKRGTENPEAFEAYLRGRYYWNTFTPDGFGKAFAAYNEAVALDPEYAQAFVALSEYYIWLSIYGVLPPKSSAAAAKEAVTKAIKIDSQLAEAYAALGFIEQLNYQWSLAETHFLRALDLNSNLPQTLIWFSLNFIKDKRFAEALSYIRRALEIDSLNPFNRYMLGWSLYMARRFDEAISEFKRGIAENSLYMPNYYGLAVVLRYLKRTDEALTAIQKAKLFSNGSFIVEIVHGQILAAAEDRRTAEESLVLIDKLSPGNLVLPFQRAILYCLLNDTKETIRMLEIAFSEQDPWMVWISAEPVFDSIRSEPLFIELLKRTGASCEQRST